MVETRKPCLRAVRQIIRCSRAQWLVWLAVTLIIAPFVPLRARGQGAVNTAALAPLPAPAQPPNIVSLSAGEQLGKDIFYDDTLSNPPGYACATCHNPQTAFTGPSSLVNRAAGPVPGVIPERFGRRNPQPIPYATFSPRGPYLTSAEGGTYVGGTFWDGRTPDTAMQARMPFLDQNEMANTPTGPYPPHAGGFSPGVARKLAARPYAGLFESFLAAMSSKLQPMNKYMLWRRRRWQCMKPRRRSTSSAPSMMPPPTGRRPCSFIRLPPPRKTDGVLFFGKAQCFECHSSTNARFRARKPRRARTHSRCIAMPTLGCQEIPEIPFMPTPTARPTRKAATHSARITLTTVSGANPNPAPDGTRFMEAQPGDIPQFDGLFKAPSLRNVDQRPYPGFVRSYMHNGVFKSLEEVVHFYNKRSVATNAAGQDRGIRLA